jgi:phosphoenolpyruvate carboxykinase (ATP)
MNTKTDTPFNLTAHGLTVREVHRNLPPSALYEHAIRYEEDASIAENGALVAYSSLSTRRVIKQMKFGSKQILRSSQAKHTAS